MKIMLFSKLYFQIFSRLKFFFFKIPTASVRPKSSISIALICTTSRRISVSASANQGLEKGNFIRP